VTPEVLEITYLPAHIYTGNVLNRKDFSSFRRCMICGGLLVPNRVTTALNGISVLIII
jgi:hypothetical protein